MNVVLDMKSYKHYYVLYREHGQTITLEYNIYDYANAHDKAVTWAKEKTNRAATVYSFTKNDFHPKEEFVANNQFVAWSEKLVKQA